MLQDMLLKIHFYLKRLSSETSTPWDLVIQILQTFQTMPAQNKMKRFLF